MINGLTDNSPIMKDEGTIVLILISVFGFILFFGYIWTVLKRQYSVIFWACSTLYNLFLAVSYFYLFSYTYQSQTILSLSPGNFYTLLLLLWTIFMSAVSFYYCFFALKLKTNKLP